MKSVDSNQATMASNDELIDSLSEQLNKTMVSGLLLVPTSGSPEGTLPFSWDDTKNYLQEYCEAGNDCVSDEFDLDCTHFVCHGLEKSKVKVNNPEATCDSDLCVRVSELAAAFKNSVDKYSNVSRITKFSDTKEGDFCFIVSWFGLSKDHAMVLSDRATSKSGKVWGHTNNRCGRREVNWEGQSLVIYRIT